MSEKRPKLEIAKRKICLESKIDTTQIGCFTISTFYFFFAQPHRFLKRCNGQLFVCYLVVNIVPYLGRRTRKDGKTIDRNFAKPQSSPRTY